MKLCSKIALAALLALPAVSFAQDDAPKPNTGNLSLTAGVDLASNYYFRGYLQENSGILYQPYAGITGALVKGDDFQLSATVATWNSVHTEKTLSDGNGSGQFYESDLTGRLDASFGKFIVSGIYTLYMYPNGAFESIQEFGIQAKFNDVGLYGETMADAGFQLNPYIGVYLETDDGNGSEDSYGEIGIAPGYTFDIGGYKLPVTFPFTLGVSIDDYYLESDGDNYFFGYGSVGAVASIPLPIPSSYGAWSLNVSGTYTNLFADSVDIANNESSHAWTGRVGVSFTY